VDAGQIARGGQVRRNHYENNGIGADYIDKLFR
jgi:hypothetical protein